MVAGDACLLKVVAWEREQGFGLPTGEHDLLSLGGVSLSGCLSDDILGKMLSAVLDSRSHKEWAKQCSVEGTGVCISSVIYYAVKPKVTYINKRCEGFHGC